MALKTVSPSPLVEILNFSQLLEVFSTTTLNSKQLSSTISFILSLWSSLLTLRYFSQVTETSSLVLRFINRQQVKETHTKTITGTKTTTMEVPSIIITGRMLWEESLTKTIRVLHLKIILSWIWAKACRSKWCPSQLNSSSVSPHPRIPSKTLQTFSIKIKPCWMIASIKSSSSISQEILILYQVTLHRSRSINMAYMVLRCFLIPSSRSYSNTPAIAPLISQE